MNTNVSANIKETRQKLHLSYDDLSAKTKIPKSTLQRYETGVTAKIPMDAVVTIAEALDVSASYLMGWDQNISSLYAGDTNNVVPDEFVLMARKIGNVSEEQRSIIYKMLDSTIDNVLEVLDKEESE